MIFGDKRIKDEILLRNCVEGAEEWQINPASINLRLGTTFLTPDPDYIIMLGQEVKYRRHKVSGAGSFAMRENEFVLATTMEKINMPRNVAAFVQGRSSIGRIGLTIQNAGFIDPGFYGHITLELVNESGTEIVLKPGYPVAQLVFFDVSEVQKPYCGKYVGQVEATESRMYMDAVKGIL